VSPSNATNARQNLPLRLVYIFIIINITKQLASLILTWISLNLKSQFTGVSVSKLLSYRDPRPFGVSLSKQILSSLVRIPTTPPQFESRSGWVSKFERYYPNSDTETPFSDSLSVPLIDKNLKWCETNLYNFRFYLCSDSCWWNFEFLREKN